MEKSGGFVWRRNGVLPPPRSGFGRGARRRNSLGTIFEIFLRGRGHLPGFMSYKSNEPNESFEITHLFHLNDLLENLNDSIDSFESMVLAEVELERLI